MAGDVGVLAAPLPRIRSSRRLSRRAASRLRASWPQILLGLLAWAILLLGIVTARNLASDVPRLGLITTGDGRVVLLDPNSAAARGGLHLGDTIYALNGDGIRGRGFSSLPSTPGVLMQLAVESGHVRALYWITSDKPSAVEAAGAWAALVAALALWISGLLAGLPRRRDVAARLYALAALAFALALCALVARDGPLLWPWPLLTPALFVGVGALLSGAIALAQPPSGRRLPRAPLVIVVLVAGLGALGAALDAYSALQPAVVNLLAAALALLALGALVAPLALHARVRDEPSRLRLRVALLAGVLGLTPPLLWPGLTAVAALLDRDRVVVLIPTTSVSPLWSAIGFVPMAGLYGALALTRPGATRARERGADARGARRLDLYTRAGLSYTIAVALCASLFVALRPVVPTQAALALDVAAALLFPFVQRGAEHLIARSVQRPAPDYDNARLLLEGLAATATTPDDLTRAVVTRLPGLLRVRGVAVLLRGPVDPPGRYHVVTRDTYAPDAPDARAAGEQGDGDFLTRSDAIVHLDDAPDLAPTLDRPIVRYGSALVEMIPPATGLAGAALWAPLRWGEAQRGLLALGPRASGDLFDEADLRGAAGVAGVLTLAFQTIELVGHLRERTDTLVSLTHRLSHAHEQERAHLSRELHDVVAQELIALTRQLRRYGDGRTPSPDIWADMLAAAQDALTHTRRICNGLRPAILDLGLIPALRDLVNDASERGGTVEVSLTVAGPEQRFAGEREFALFRVAQEGLTNALEHAMARQVRVEVLFDGTVRLRVRDDGTGFVVPARFEDLPGDHLGLIGMRERLAEFGGTLTVTSTPGRGTVLETCVPLSVVSSQ